jgi:ATP/maltotriose-dependent transcriptional regulator MalT
VLARPRLTEKLERGAGRKLTLLCGPAGKTTLLNEWTTSRAS